MADREPVTDVRFGSLADLFSNITGMSACGGKAVVRRPDFTSLRLNVCFSSKRTFRSLRIERNKGPITAMSGHVCYSATTSLAGPIAVQKGDHASLAIYFTTIFAIINGWILQ